MKTVRLFVLAIVFLALSSSVYAQEIDFLKKARQCLAEGDCNRAQENYDAYKFSSGKTDKEVEQLIKECGSEIEIRLRISCNLTFTVNGVSFTMKDVEGGTFWMGAQSANPSGQNYDVEAIDWESPVHSVTVSSFYMGETEVTQALWFAVMGSNPSHFKGDDLPVENVSWNDCQNFIRELNRMTGKNFRLPTEAEWEYAARGGKKSKGYRYAGSNKIVDVAGYEGNSYNKGNGSPDYGTHRVKSKKANELSLYDMSGNVWEWCQDGYDSSYYSSSPSTNPTGPSRSGSDHSLRVLRGGSWGNSARDCRVSYRGDIAPGSRGSDVGFRLVLPQ